MEKCFIRDHWVIRVCIFCLDPGYSICWDNVQVNKVARYQGSTRPNKFLMWAMSYVALNRTDFTYLSDLKMDTIRATEMPLSTFLPQEGDVHVLKEFLPLR